MGSKKNGEKAVIFVCVPTCQTYVNGKMLGLSKQLCGDDET